MKSDLYVKLRVEHVPYNALCCYSVLLCAEYIFMSTIIKLCKNNLPLVKMNSSCDDHCYAWSAGLIFHWFS
jgi:hypothetical protein